MSFFEEIGLTVQASFAELFAAFIGFIPSIVAALVIIIVGLLIAGALGQLVRRLVELTKVDALVSKVDMIERLNQSGGKVTLSGVLGWLVKWFLVLVTLIAVADILALS